MPTRSILLRSLAFNFAIIVALSGLSIAAAQSGRHVPKSKPAVLNPEPEAAPTRPAKKPDPIVRFILGMDHTDGFSSVSLNTLSGIRENCGQRLGEPVWAVAEIMPSGMSRSDAINRAKSEKDSYVVWLEVKEDTISSKQTGTPNNAYIGYTVFAPSTAKVFTSGATYPLPEKNVLIGRRTPVAAGDYYFNKAATEAADRILAKFKTAIR